MNKKIVYGSLIALLICISAILFIVLKDYERLLSLILPITAYCLIMTYKW